MADQDKEVDEGARATPGAAPAYGLPFAAASREAADAFLHEQTVFTRLQRRELEHEIKLRTASLRVRHTSEILKLAFEFALAAIFTFGMALLATVAWQASRADGLVIESFSVPPSFAARGTSGDQVAGDMMAKLAAIRAAANGASYGTSQDVHNGRDDDVKVEIPDTGISLTEVWRLLRGWLGQERRLSGDLRQTGDGKIALTAHLAGAESVTATGPAEALDRLEQQVAEKIFGQFDPLNQAIYLYRNGRPVEAMAAAEGYAQTTATPLERAAAFSLWADLTRRETGDVALARARAKLGIGFDPAFVFNYVALWRIDSDLGKQEGILEDARAVLPLKERDQPERMRHDAVAAIHQAAVSWLAVLTGDFAGAGLGECARGCPLSRVLFVSAGNAARGHDVGAARALIEQGVAAGPPDLLRAAVARAWSDMAAEDWTSVISDIRAAMAAETGRTPASSLSEATIDRVVATQFRPWLALAEAKMDDFAAAHAEIAKTPADCTDCQRVRGMIDALEKNWSGADYWFARAVHDAPSIPFAYADWGAALIRRGDLDGAIAKFAAAHRKGPHFADPLELWGEALIAKNRSDLAIAKFAEANQYAPNWGRLHLKWGEALIWSGRKDEAKKQFSAAARLDLSTADKAVLSAWAKSHG